MALVVCAKVVFIMDPVVKYSNSREDFVCLLNSGDEKQQSVEISVFNCAEECKYERRRFPSPLHEEEPEYHSF